MAEGILKARLKEAGRDDIDVSSMGIHAPKEQKASAEAVSVSAKHGIDLSHHQSRQLVFDELRVADYIFAMERYHKDYIRTFVPQTGDKLALLASWPGKEKKDHEIPDPIGGTQGDYEKSYNRISSQIDRIMPFLLAELI
jgi:protein-tyrosine-phosphatase